ncbi:MAG: methyl-accepting chemotaxis protein [Dechloromonas sp.]|nr:MAG: methyl-accepting chemotaxis protein [Dechloromonas sp.]
MRVSTRLQALVALTLLGLLILCITALLQLRDSMLDDRKVKLRNLVDVAVGIVDHQHKLVAAGKLDEASAKVAARDTLRMLRFDKEDYFFGFDTSGTYVVHGTKAEWEGSNKIDLKDTRGTLLIRELIGAAQKGGGFVEYWFPKPGQQKDEPKLSYAALFAPWGWVLGTGIYIDDIDREFKAVAYKLGGVSLALLVVLMSVSYLIGRSILQQLGGEPAEANRIMQQIANGDLTTSVGHAPSGSLLHTLGGTADTLRRMMQEINDDANRLVENARRIAIAADEVARSAEQQSDATSAMAAAIEELTVSSNHISDSARETSANSTEALSLSAQGSERVGMASRAIEKIASTVSDASTRIRALEARAGQISSIANVIKDIAGQTNLLALNAAIEAARAGEQGRGFAVVADEVRKLAERTSAATTEIDQMITGIQSETGGAVAAMDAALPEVQHGVELAGSASESLNAIESGARRTLERVGEVADATHEQSAASTSIAQRVEQVANMVEETTNTIRGTASSAHELEVIAGNLKALIGRFRVT